MRLGKCWFPRWDSIGSPWEPIRNVNHGALPAPPTAGTQWALFLFYKSPKGDSDACF